MALLAHHVDVTFGDVEIVAVGADGPGAERANAPLGKPAKTRFS
jgi:hypothetical protein